MQRDGQVHHCAHHDCDRPPLTGNRSVGQSPSRRRGCGRWTSAGPCRSKFLRTWRPRSSPLRHRFNVPAAPPLVDRYGRAEGACVGPAEASRRRESWGSSRRGQCIGPGSWRKMRAGSLTELVQLAAKRVSSQPRSERLGSGLEAAQPLGLDQGPISRAAPRSTMHSNLRTPCATSVA